MTTINNSELIEKVGGIEKAREIITGAPSNAVIYWPIAKGKFGVYSAGEQNKSDRQIILDNLRTAIAEHDSREFKVGDLVCFNNSRIMFPNGETKTNELFRVIRSDGLEVDLTEIGKLNVYKTWVGDLRHATPSEIKAGHRIDDTTDHVTDIRNHVSPSTIVKDLEAERHG